MGIDALYGPIDSGALYYYAGPAEDGNKIGVWDGMIVGLAKGDRLVEMVPNIGSNFLLPLFRDRNSLVPYRLAAVETV